MAVHHGRAMIPSSSGMMVKIATIITNSNEPDRCVTVIQFSNFRHYRDEVTMTSVIYRTRLYIECGLRWILMNCASNGIEIKNQARRNKEQHTQMASSCISSRLCKITICLLVARKRQNTILPKWCTLLP